MTTKRDIPDPHEQTDLGLMTIAAVRYCINKDGYLVGAAVRWLVDRWPDLQDYAKCTILQDIVVAFLESDATTDNPAQDSRWAWFANWAFTELSDTNKDWVRRSVFAVRGKQEFPFA
jgi:hypothetical protein